MTDGSNSLVSMYITSHTSSQITGMRRRYNPFLIEMFLSFPRILRINTQLARTAKLKSQGLSKQDALISFKPLTNISTILEKNI